MYQDRAFNGTGIVKPENRADFSRRRHCFYPRSKFRNSILMTYHYQDLGSASDWMKQIEPIRNSTQNLEMTRHQYGISALVPKPSFRGNTAGGVAKFRLLLRKKINKCNSVCEYDSRRSAILTLHLKVHNLIGFDTCMVLGMILYYYQEWLNVCF